jgi:signal transduction histidine kinase/DNA-binding response OmpR family regulator
MDKRMVKRAAIKRILSGVGILVLGGLLLTSRSLVGQDSGTKYFRNYSYKEYDHQPQNWGIAQDPDGIIYVANHGGVLMYDGVDWRLIYVPNMTVRSLAIDEKGTVYVGGNGEVGFLKPDDRGFLQYISLNEHLEEDQRSFSNVWRSHATEEGIYFCPSELLLRWDPKARQMKAWKPDHRFLYSFTVGGRLWIHQQNIGLMQMSGDSLEILPGGDMFTEPQERIFLIAPFPGGSRKILIGTRFTGFYVYDGKRVTPFPTGADDYLKKNIAFHGIRLCGGDFALATAHGGLIIMDADGRLKGIYDKSAGLQDDEINYILEDNQENLWLCLGRGITKIEYASGLSIHDERSGLAGMVLSVVRHHDHLYAGTNKGLYYLASPRQFRPVPGLPVSCWGLLSLEDCLLAATSAGVFRIDNRDNIEGTVTRDISYVLLRSRQNPGHIWCGSHYGLVILSRQKGQWAEKYRLNEIGQPVHSIAEDPKGRVWLGTLTGTVFRVDVPGSMNRPGVSRYDTSHGLPGGEIYTTAAAGHVMFATERGMYRFAEATERFVADPTLGNGFCGGPDARPVFRLSQDEGGHIWFHSASRNYRAIPNPNGSFTVQDRPFRRLPLVQVNTIYPDPDGHTVWLGSIDGLIHYDKTFKKNYDLHISALIREVAINETTAIFGGHGAVTGSEANGFSPVIDYKDRNLRFRWAAPFFENESATQYRYFLEGYDRDWCQWTDATQKDYTNLDNGRYRFRVDAQNIYRTPSRKAVFSFKVLPPWYKTWWAFSLYAAALFLSMFLVVKWRSSRLTHEKQRLEGIVKERTREINEKNQQLEDQSRKLTEMDRVKSRFFANISHEFRTPLTLIMSPVEEMLANSRDPQQKKRLNLMLHNSQRLLTLINQLLDLSRFDSGKMRLQASLQDIVPFLKGILSAFHLLARQHQLDLEFHSQHEEIALYFDSQKMEDVMTNLLINAVKFTPPGGKITVSLSLNRQQPPGFVNISVQDTGIGIAGGQLAHIFNRFYQADDPREKARQGTGIGLALTREIVLLHHGKIDVHSQAGKGSEFVIQLPLGKSHLQPEDIAAPDKAAAPASRAEEIEALYASSEEETRPEAETADPEKPVILVVEDHDDMRALLRESLAPHYSVAQARNGRQGIEKAKELIPDLIVSDIMMPEVDGYELCRALKTDIQTSHIPIILLTAKASQECIIDGLETGADDYITKPFNSRMLLSRIKNLIELRRQLQLKIQRQKMLLPNEIPVSSIDDEFLQKFQHIIEENLDDPEFTIDILCDRLDMGRSTLFKKIRALTGETPNQFILSYRLERGAQLLKDKARSVTDVALDVGFSSPAYFATCFKEKFHQSPSAYQAAQTSPPPPPSPQA